MYQSFNWNDISEAVGSVAWAASSSALACACTLAGSAWATTNASVALKRADDWHDRTSVRTLPVPVALLVSPGDRSGFPEPSLRFRGSQTGSDALRRRLYSQRLTAAMPFAQPLMHPAHFVP
ncbi:MAG: hypothetical protein IPF73_15075 [Betaproteobacteria bacterium]|nr:hypothetical protein [Betaproteobacteria bacterium]